jgi:glycosyltransferase involved in cell wall biosynthesis
MPTPIVTIGLCVKNSERTIREVANSIVNQDFPPENMEIAIVDGCSNDRTMQIAIDVFSKANLRIFTFSENVGLGFARQIVIDNASGKYVLWVDSDIILSRNYVRQLVDSMERHPDVAITVGCQGFVPDDNWVALLESVSYIVESHRKQGKVTSNLLGTRGSIFRTIAVRIVGGFDLSIKGAQEDIDMAEKLRSSGWKFFVKNAIFYEKQKRTWKELWKRHFWYGYGLHFIQHKSRGRNILASRSNDWIIFSAQAYKLTYRKIVFLLPLNFLFRKVSQIFGFFQAHFDGYGHRD